MAVIIEHEISSQCHHQNNMEQQIISTFERTTAIKAEAEKSQPLSAIFKLDVDCSGKILDYLSLADLINLSQTCKVMHTVASHILQLHYPFVRVIVDNDRIFLRNHDEVQSFIDIFIEHIPIALFKNNISNHLWHQFKSIRIAHFHYARLKEPKIKLMTGMLQNVDLLQLTACQFDDGMFECLIDKCTKVKFLAIAYAYNCGVNWLHRKYPSLELVAILPILNGNREIKELTVFFKQNPNVRRFYTTSKFLLKNKAFVMDAKFDDLTILIDDMNFDSFCVLLNELYAKGVYKQFYIAFFEYLDIKQTMIDQLNYIHGLAGLSVPFNVVNVDLKSFTSLEILQFNCNVNQIMNMPQLPQYLTNLREISFYRAKIGDILPFVHQLTELKKLAVTRLDDDPCHGIDLMAVNKKREKLLDTTAHVSKVIIYIPEDIYLITRFKSITMVQNLVEIQRYDQYNYVRF